MKGVIIKAVVLGSVVPTAGPWQEVDRRVKYGWRLALLRGFGPRPSGFL